MSRPRPTRVLSRQEKKSRLEMNYHIHALGAFITASLAYEDVKTVHARLDVMKKRESFDPA